MRSHRGCRAVCLAGVLLAALLAVARPCAATAAELELPEGEASFRLMATTGSRTKVYSYDQGSLGFFDYIGSEDALGVVSISQQDPVLGPYQDVSAAGQRTSAFNLDNMRQSIQILRWCNEIRRSCGLSELRVDPGMMAISQCQLNYSNPQINHSGVFLVAENLAWGYPNPFDGWYDAERAIWMRPENAAARDWFYAYAAQHGYNDALNEMDLSPYASLSAQVGHYLNVVHPDYVLTGASFILNGTSFNNVSGQVFTSDRSITRTYTVDEFSQLFETYCAALGTPVEQLGYAIGGTGTYCDLLGSQTVAQPGDEVHVVVSPMPSCEFSYVTIRDASGADVPFTWLTTEELCFSMPASDVTVTAVCVAVPNAVTLRQSGHGTIRADASSACYGDGVTVVARPDAGYVAGAIVVTDADGNRVKTGFGSDGERYFVMPGSPVSVSATWRPEGSLWPCPGDDFCPARCYDDLPQASWYHRGADWAIANGVMTGTFDPEGETSTFNATGSLSRAEMAQVLYNLAGRPTVDASLAGRFDDCSADAWYAPAVAWAVGEGIFGGYSEHEFGPGDGITREQFALVLWRSEGRPASTDATSRFPDAGCVSPWAREGLDWAVGEGLISGFDTGRLGPGVTLNRAMAATILQRWRA